MDDLKEIKKRLIREEKVRDILEAIECGYVKEEQRGLLVTGQLPERFHSSNKRAVQAKMNEGITCSIRNRPDFKGDIYFLVSYIHHDKRGERELFDDIPNAKKFICELFGWTEYINGSYKSRTDYVAPLKAILKGKKKKKEYKPNPVLPEEIMNEFYYKGQPLPYKGWIEEGISYNTQVMYGVGFDLESKRIVFPLRNRFGKIVGVKGRIMKTEDDPERKYLYLYRCNNRYEWFNWHYAHPYILMEKKVYIVESEKSCMKLFEHGIYNVVAIGSSEIAEEQAQMIKQLGLDIQIILCYDKGIERDIIEEQAVIFDGRDVRYMFDEDDLLENKDAPIDRGIDIWSKLDKEYIFEVNFKKAV